MPITLRLGPGVREWFLPHLSRNFPQLTLQYCRLYQRVEAAEHYRHKTLGLAGQILAGLRLQKQPGRMERPPAVASQSQQLRLSI